MQAMTMRMRMRMESISVKDMMLLLCVEAAVLGVVDGERVGL